MIVLDTNVVSEMMRPAPKPSVLSWLNAQVAEELWLNSIVVSELLFGIARLPGGARKRQLADTFAAMLILSSVQVETNNPRPCSETTQTNGVGSEPG